MAQPALQLIRHPLLPSLRYRVSTVPASAHRPHGLVCPACLIEFVCYDDACRIFAAGRLFVCPPCTDDMAAAFDELDRARLAAADAWEDGQHAKDRT